MKTDIRSLTWAALALALSAGAAVAGPGAAGHSDAEMAYGKPGDPKKPARIIQIAMGERDGKMEFIPAKIEIRRGEQIKFQLRNNGALDHELVMATLQENLDHAIEMKKNPDMEHDNPNAKRLAPKKTGEIVWLFTKAGQFDFSCLIPGHREAGMTGTIVVK